MPEGPELHLAARYISRQCQNLVFAGKIQKSAVSTRNPDVDFTATSEKQGYKITAEARGKEMKIHLQDVAVSSHRSHILFRFGMSGCFKLTSVKELPKHAHLKFFAKNKDTVLSFVDYRRFGKWEVEGSWGQDRGPDPMFEYDDFRANVLSNLEKAAFNRPICEAIMNQKFFNGIGNYLRAEILHRAHIPPFDQAREVLNQLLLPKTEIPFKAEETPDILQLCSIVPKESLSIDVGGGYDTERGSAEFKNWLQCYSKEGMKNLVDSTGRTVWFASETGAGQMVPKNAKTRVRKKWGAETEEENVETSQPIKKPKKMKEKEVTKPVKRTKPKVKEEDTKPAKRTKPKIEEVDTKPVTVDLPRRTRRATTLKGGKLATNM